ncbi:MAG: hypothetical protein SFW36_08925 [Leptolyngbyaceae cyanobacterium bins.59]|nr:hypothetical protein [Leptolyngbyaceae cyanobacterium bins.59]
MPAYQSRSLSFISQQTRRLSDRVSRTLRQLKTATVWGAQILLYPVYLGFQTTRLAGRQLQQEIRQIQLELEAVRNRSTPNSSMFTSPPVLAEPVLPEPVLSDLGVQKMLHTPTDLWTQAPDAGALAIRGVACRLDDRHLVLITSQNDPLDILTSEQEQQLQRWIIQEIANYHYRQRSRRLQERPFTTRLPLPSDRPQVFLPVRLFRRVMAWMQQSSVAMTVNLFQEARTETIPSRVFWTPHDCIDLERTDPIPVRELAWEGGFPLPNQSPYPALSAADPDIWLNLSDLFDSRVPDPEPQVIAALVQEQYQSTSLVTQLEITTQTGKQGVIQQVRRTISAVTASRGNRSGKLAIDPNASEPNGPESLTIAVPSSAVSTAVTPDLAVSGLDGGEVAPTWIEADVQLVGYVKHPLEQVIEWLDRVITWLENRAIGLSQRLGQWMRSNRSDR